MQKQPVFVSLLYDKGDKTPVNFEPNWSGETDTNGEALYKIPEPAPSHFSVMVHLTSEHWNCDCWVMGDTKDLIQKGIVGPQPTANSKTSDGVFKAAPGEVLILVRPFSFFERLLYPLLKE